MTSPAETTKYDDVLLPFLSLMRKELHANAGKGDRPGWLKMDAKTALLEVHHHLAKLQKAVLSNDGPGIMEFSADVANMAMMVLDVCGGLAWVEVAPGAVDAGAIQQMRTALIEVDPASEEAYTDDMVRVLVRAATGDAASGKAVAWHPMDSAPLSGEFLASIEVNYRGRGETLRHMHVLMLDDETGAIHSDYEQGWDLGDYEAWTHLPKFAAATPPACPEPQEPGAGKLEALPGELVIKALQAMDAEARKRGSMYPQTADEQDEDTRAVRRVIESLRFYTSERQSRNGWPSVKDWPALPAASASQAAPQPLSDGGEHD